MNKIRRSYDEIIFRNGISSLYNARLNYDQYKSLYEADFKVFSQYGEDGILDFLLTKLKIYKPSFLEIGTQNYSESNTRFIYQRTNCSGKIIDCDLNLSLKVKNVLGSYLWKGDLEIISEFITVENLFGTLKIKNEKDIINNDIFSLDIDGNDYWIMEKLINKINSKIIVLEYNPYFGGSKSVTVPYDPNFDRTNYHYSNLCWGCSLKALFLLLDNNNYIFVGSNLNNNNGFWIRSDLLDQINIKPPSIDSLDEFTNCFARESRDKDNKLSYISGESRLKEIENCNLIDLESNSKSPEKIKKIFNK